MKAIGTSGVFLFFILLCASTAASSQGCAQCRDNAAVTSPATQRAYRRAIGMMAFTGTSLFAVTVVLFKRFR